MKKKSLPESFGKVDTNKKIMWTEPSYSIKPDPIPNIIRQIEVLQMDMRLLWRTIEEMIRNK